MALTAVLKLVDGVNANTPALEVIPPQTMVPEELVVSALLPEHVPKLPMVVEPMLETEKSVVVANAAVEEEILKSVWLVSPLTAATESFANGDVEPRPTLPLSRA